MKRLCSGQAFAAPEAKQRKVKYETYKNWITEHDRECQTASWLDGETEIVAGKRYIVCD